MAKYRLYVDEVGNPSLKRTHLPDNRFPSLTGVVADLDYIQSDIYPNLEVFKAKCFYDVCIYVRFPNKKRRPSAALFSNGLTTAHLRHYGRITYMVGCLVQLVNTAIICIGLPNRQRKKPLRASFPAAKRSAHLR